MIDLKNSILILVVLSLALLFGVYIPYEQYHRAVREAPLPVNAEEGSVVHVMYTNSGFEPQDVTVPTGTTVQWVNTSDKLMWVASDDHPSHTDLPGFDQKGIEGNVNEPQSALPVAYAHTGTGVYSFTFIEVGTWEYHNHLVPGDRGVVTVLKP